MGPTTPLALELFRKSCEMQGAGDTEMAALLNSAHEEIERLQRGGVSVHETRINGQQCTIMDDGSVRRELEARIATLEAEVAVRDRALRTLERSRSPLATLAEQVAHIVAQARAELAREQEAATDANNG